LNESPDSPKSTLTRDLCQEHSIVAATGQHLVDSECRPVTVSDVRFQKLITTWNALPELAKRAIEALLLK
jgi:hypothetical protein